MYEMKPEYYIGIDMIDEEHKQLFKYADEAYELLRDDSHGKTAKSGGLIAIHRF